MTRTRTVPGRGRIVLLVLVAVAATVVLALPTWAEGRLETATGTVELSATGMSGAPAVWAGALVAGAAALLAAMSGRVGTTVAGVATFGAGVVVVIGAAGAAREPAALMLADARVATGTNAPTVHEATATLWPWGAVVIGAAMCLLGVVLLALAPRWSSAGRRFERGVPAAGSRPASPATDPDGIAHPGSASAAADAARDRYVDDWDALGRGEDPTAGDR